METRARVLYSHPTDAICKLFMREPQCPSADEVLGSSLARPPQPQIASFREEDFKSSLKKLFKKKILIFDCRKLVNKWIKMMKSIVHHHTALLIMIEIML
jgi:hypothetical protein